MDACAVGLRRIAGYVAAGHRQRAVTGIDAAAFARSVPRDKAGNYVQRAARNADTAADRCRRVPRYGAAVKGKYGRAGVITQINAAALVRSRIAAQRAARHVEHRAALHDHTAASAGGVVTVDIARLHVKSAVRGNVNAAAPIRRIVGYIAARHRTDAVNAAAERRRGIARYGAVAHGER